MFDFNFDETIFFGVAIFGTAFWLVPYLGRILALPKFNAGAAGRAVMGFVPFACAGGTYFVIHFYSDRQVRFHGDYVALFMAGQGLWLGMTDLGMRLLGVSIADDVLTRSNPAALSVATGAMIATSCIYAACNIGGGPTIWTTLIPAFTGTILLAIVWIAIDCIGASAVDAITIDRDIAAGVRLCGALIGCGIILGRAGAGQWISWNETFSSFVRIGWPVLPLALATGIVHRFARPTPKMPQPPIVKYGIIPAAASVVAGLVVVAAHRFPLDPSKW